MISRCGFKTPTVAYFTKEPIASLAKPPMKFNGGSRDMALSLQVNVWPDVYIVLLAVT